ncbi:hypothetical protein L1049_010877 [Liquidambar formosana]|uniref:Uncharacterized protein n=1 Tax=Liquidambar formosana TaxID=63359 RepID=A0AAP0RQ65_LIQFO
MANPSFLSPLLLALLVLSPLSSAQFADDLLLPSIARFPSTQAEKLIRELNLFPKDDVNIVKGHDSTSSSKIVEKPLRFPNLVDPSVSVEDLGHYAGYYKIQNSHAAKMFYFFFESRNNKKDPIVIWLTGGPGCSSELAVFYENGPFSIASNLSLVWNEYGWDKASNLLYVDQPIGTGFSYSSDRRDIRHNEEGVSNDLYDFLQALMAQSLAWLHILFAMLYSVASWLLLVHDAGHMVPMDQPKASLEMLKRWTQGTISEATTEPENLAAAM